MTLFYNLILFTLQIIIFISLPFILLFNKRLYRELLERLGHNGSHTSSFKPIWLQAASVGEVTVAEKIINVIKNKHPDLKILLTVTTATGKKLARDRIKEAESIRYFPFDFKRSVRAFLDQVDPRLFIMIETEIWPNLTSEIGKRNIPGVIVNGRISDKSFKKYRMVKPLISRALKNITMACMSSPLYASRIIKLGIPVEKVIMTGNIKFDISNLPSHEERTSLMNLMGIDKNHEVFLAGSTAEGEDSLIIDAYLRASKICKQPVLLIAPRYPQRALEVEHLIKQKGLTSIKLSSLKQEENKHPKEVIIIDTIGDLSKIYSFGTIIFVGGSLVPKGGHNILEPAAFGKPVLFGKYMENFKDIANAFVKNGAGFMVRDAEELHKTIEFLLKNKEIYNITGQKAKKIVEENSGSLQATIKEIEGLL